MHVLQGNKRLAQNKCIHLAATKCDPWEHRCVSGGFLQGIKSQLVLGHSLIAQYCKTRATMLRVVYGMVMRHTPHVQVTLYQYALGE